MTSMDKAGIVISVVIVAIGVGFAAVSSSFVSDVSLPSDRISIENGKKEMEFEMLVAKQAMEDAKQIVEKTEQVIEKGKQSAEEIAETTKELTTSKLPARLVSIPKDTAVPGCEDVDKCYDPPSLIIFKGGEVIWKNDDSSAHTVTSGDIINGPDGEFNSGLIKSNETFSHKFDETGNYDYFCMIHPWANASVIVK